ncbi:MAG: peptidoglycan-binding domain-containing protein [Polyangiales bacterium]
MPTRHKVQAGECVVSISESYGFFWETLWAHPENEGLRNTRRDPTVLLPGDVIYIPDKTIKSYVRPTDARHTFRVKNVPAKFELRLRSEDGTPRSGLAYVLVIDGREIPGTTDGNGAVKASISPTAREGVLRLTESGEEFEIDLGHMDPVDTIRGAKMRLSSLGTYNGPIDDSGDASFSRALEAFQGSHGLQQTGLLDASTQDALRTAFGS